MNTETEEDKVARREAALRRFDAVVAFIEALGYDPADVTLIRVKPPFITVTERQPGGTKIKREHLFLVPNRLRNTGEVAA